MKIGIDISPLETHHFLQHRVRGTGFYIEQLKESLQRYYPNNTYILFTRGEKLFKDIDLVHYPYLEPFFLTLPLRKPFPTIVTIHDLIPLVFPQYFPPGIGGTIKWYIQKFSLKGTAAIIVDSEASKRDVIKFTAAAYEKVHVVYLAPSSFFKPVADAAFSDGMRIKYGLPHKFVLYVGDATWNKNLPRLLEGIKKINLTLVMVGKALASDDFDRTNPWNRDLLKVQAKAQGDKRIIRLGFVPVEDLLHLYNAATVFAMPSLYEGFGLPILEAMACGVPVVTAKAGSLAEVAGDAALYVDPYDIDSIANGIGEVFFSKVLQSRLSNKALQQAKNFSWEKTAMETIKVYEKVLGK